MGVKSLNDDALRREGDGGGGRRVRGVNSFVVLLIGGRAKWTNRHISCLAARIGSNLETE
jgi:hypothetical protein